MLPPGAASGCSAGGGREAGVRKAQARSRSASKRGGEQWHALCICTLAGCRLSTTTSRVSSESGLLDHCEVSLSQA
eukprot:12562923-Alexandrium_andersonii.AAC.1